MKKSMLLLLALILICSSIAATVAASDDVSILPVLKLDVKVDPNCKTNVTYIAQLSPVLTTSNAVPVIVFYCDGVAIAKVPINNLGTAIYRFWQKPGKYQAVAVCYNINPPIKSLPVDYYVPLGGI